MARIIPAFIHFEDGDAPPKLTVSEGGSSLSESIAEMGLEIEEGSLNLAKLESNPDSHNSEIEPSQDLAEAGEQPRNGYRSCMADMLARPEGAKKLNQKESQGRFKEAARECSARRVKEAVEN